MTNNNKRVRKTVLRKALFSSVISLILCCAMLVGTTFAWFTDSVTSANNVIKSGNLDIEVEYTLDGENWKDLDGAYDLFQKGLWEPGHTEVVVLKITNNGTLALKYNANMNIINETVGKNKENKDIVLSDILTVGTCTQQYTNANGTVASGADIFPAMAFNGEGGVDGWIGYQTTSTFKTGSVLKNDKKLEPKESDYLAIKVDMAETVSNEANHNGTDIPTIEFGINVLATQFTYEEDSFGKDYDKDAQYKESETTYVAVGTLEELNAALNSAVDNTIITLTKDISGTAVMNTTNNADVTIDGNGFKLGNVNLNGTSNKTLKNITFDAANATSCVDGNGNTRQNALIFTGDSANNPGKGARNLVIDGCTFTGTFTNSGAAIAFADRSRTSGQSGNITIKGCTFETKNAYYDIYATPVEKAPRAP